MREGMGSVESGMIDRAKAVRDWLPDLYRSIIDDCVRREDAESIRLNIDRWEAMARKTQEQARIAEERLEARAREIASMYKPRELEDEISSITRELDDGRRRLSRRRPDERSARHAVADMRQRQLARRLEVFRMALRLKKC